MCGDSTRLLGQGAEVGDEVSALLLLLDAGEGHLGAGHELLGVLEVHVEHLGGPGHAGLEVGLGVGEALDGAGLAADDAEQVGADSVSSALGGGVALGSAALEQLLSLGDVTHVGL